MFQLKDYDSIGFVSSSNGLDIKLKSNINDLINLFSSININIVISKSLFKDENNNTYSGLTRAKEIMDLFKDPSIKAIFDLSGGDLCNEVLNYLDFDIIKKYNKPFFGYSDVSVLINSIFNNSKIISYNYQLRNLLMDESKTQIQNFKNTFLKGGNDLFDFKYNFLQGTSMAGIIIGGNIRCFLKLAGTKFMPNFDNKILFLEGLSGDINKISTFLEQYNQLGAFDKVNGILLGTFTELENSYPLDFVCNLLVNKINRKNLPIAKTQELGHSSNSKAIAIGKFISLK